MKQVFKQIKERYQIELHSKSIKYQLWRLDDSEYRKLRENSLPIKDDYMFSMNLYLSERQSEDKLNLAKLFVTLTWLFGDSSDLFDDWKGSFCFPVLLVLKKEMGNFFYLMRIYDHRGSVYFSLYRVLENGVEDYDPQIVREPFELEFSRQEINYFLNFFYGYMAGYFEKIKLILPTQYFIKKIDSNFIIYGYKDAQYF